MRLLTGALVPSAFFCLVGQDLDSEALHPPRQRFLAEGVKVPVEFLSFFP